MMHAFNRRTAMAALAAFATPAVFAQGTYPNKALRVIVPQPPGGGFDFVGRILADRLGKALYQPVVVENRTGSGTLVGTDLAAKAEPDGYTLLVGSISNLALNMGLYKSPPYNSLRDFEPLGLGVSYSYTLMGRKDLPYRTLKDVVAFAKANPGKLTYASAGVGSGQHVLAAALWQQAGVDVTHVPYRGAQAAYQDMIGGRVDLFFDLSPTARPQIEGNGLNGLVVSGATRQPTLPDVPTIRETGVAKLELESWFGLFAPAKTPPKVLERLRAELETIIASKEVSDVFRKNGGRSLSLSLPETRALVKRDVEFWSKLIRDLDIKAE
ncbi:MAG: tripartite tricarboxylate transporter substrate binding protein [Polaromonas sp.]|nr:tripartite tricarboxylate transporter substrate binding protein [Polaromonas sp.]